MIPKFRAWSTFKNEWVKHFYITESGLIYNMEQPHRDLIGAVPVEKSGLILIQSTDLKDKNGVEIFEGDIVKCCRLFNDSLSEYVGQVKFVDFGWNIVDKADTHEPFYNYKDGCPDEIREIEVIGNIHKNPKLLESVEQ